MTSEGPDCLSVVRQLSIRTDALAAGSAKTCCMRTYDDRPDPRLTYAFATFTVLGNVAFAAWGALSEITAGPAHDEEMFAGIGYVFAAVWGVPAAIAALLLTASRLFTDQHDTRLGLAVLASALNVAPWALLIAVR
jgi:hypothetical protein